MGPWRCSNCGADAEPRRVRLEQAGRLEVVECPRCGDYDGRVTALGEADTRAAIDAGLFDVPEGEVSDFDEGDANCGPEVTLPVPASLPELPERS